MINISHEALILDLEDVLTHDKFNQKQFYNLSSHFLWIGYRTSQTDHAHMEYMRGI